MFTNDCIIKYVEQKLCTQYRAVAAAYSFHVKEFAKLQLSIPEWSKTEWKWKKEPKQTNEMRTCCTMQNALQTFLLFFFAPFSLQSIPQISWIHNEIDGITCMHSSISLFQLPAGRCINNKNKILSHTSCGGGQCRLARPNEKITTYSTSTHDTFDWSIHTRNNIFRLSLSPPSAWLCMKWW